MKPSIVLAALVFATSARAQGIPVIDVSVLGQTIQQVTNDIAQINNQIQQITQLQSHLASINGVRNLGTVLDNPTLRNYVPPQAYAVIDALQSSGYSALTPTGKALRDAAMQYNCLDLTGAARNDCQWGLAAPYQMKGLLQDAMHSASSRLSQIGALMRRVDATTDQKSIQEMQARLLAENAMLAHETSQLQMLQGLADAEERIARSRDRERQYEALTRAGKISNYLP